MTTEMQSDADRLGDYIHRHGPVKGRIAMAMDQLVDADAIIGQHRVYNRQSHDAPPPQASSGSNKPWEDLALARRTLSDARALLQQALLHH
ncbi:MAG: hypothetical protein EA379_02800 [Phycisphaerales bacterium]|nr:MAG: hypothetical protein EA379_02800 [Phycisphaerales bacterium]